MLELEIVQQDYINEWLNLEDYYYLLEDYNNFPDLEDDYTTETYYYLTELHE